MQKALDLIFDEAELELGGIEASAGTEGYFGFGGGAAFLVVLDGEPCSGEGIAEGVGEASGELSEEAESFGLRDLVFETGEALSELIGGLLELGEFDDGAGEIGLAIVMIGEILELILDDEDLSGIAGGEPGGDEGGETSGGEGESDDGPDEFAPGESFGGTRCENENALR